MFNDEIKLEIYKILDDLPSENACVDYKTIPYENNKICEFVKDLCAFLNSEESLGKNKFIILGVQEIENQKKIIGLINIPMQDDNFYQGGADFIFPRPMIETGTLNYKYRNKDYPIGYIFISKDNTDRIYEINKDCFDKKDDNKYSLKDLSSRVACESTAWIRMGSCKRLLNEYSRRKIYENSQKEINYSQKCLSEIAHASDKKNIILIKTLLLFGQWNENNINDKDIISRYVGITYDGFVSDLRQIIKTEADISFKNGKWKIKNRERYIENYHMDFYKDDFLSFQKIVEEILSEKAPKLELEPDKRAYSNIYDKSYKYSDEIRNGVAELLVLVRKYEKNFSNCKNSASNFAVLSIRNILNKSDWNVWASLDQLLPYLAESEPNEFLEQFNNYLKRDTSVKIISEKEISIFEYEYLTSIYWSLELIAWDTNYFMRACLTLFRIAKFNIKSLEIIRNIIIPWYPNTNAPSAYMIRLIENMFKIDNELTWKLLMMLMPGKTTMACPTYKPKYINIPIEEQQRTNKEYYDMIQQYIDLALKNCKYKKNPLIDLIELLDNIDDKDVVKICTYFNSNIMKLKPDSFKYSIWDKVENVKNRVKKFSQNKSNINENLIIKLEQLSSFIKPSDGIYIAKRLFKKDIWDLIDCEDYENSKNELQNKRKKTIKDLYNMNFEFVLKLGEISEDSFLVGFLFALNKLKIEETKKIIKILNYNNKMLKFAEGFIYQKYNLCGELIDNEIVNLLNTKGKIRFLLNLKYCMSTYELVENLLGKYSFKYWEEIDIRCIDNSYELDYVSKKLMIVNRYDRVLWIYRLSSFNNSKIDYNNDIIFECLFKINNLKTNVSRYDICEAINDLQINNADKDRLFNIEWKYLALLDSENYRPITIEQAMADDVQIFIDLISLAYKEHSKNKNSHKVNQEVATNAYNMLYKWKIIPGTDIKGNINGDKLNKWYVEMIEKCKRIDRLEVGLLCFGKVLFFSKNDKSGFWINKTVAKILNDDELVRRGYSNKALNDVGIVNYDKEGNAYLPYYNKYINLADLTEMEGYYNFAATLRKIADSFKLMSEDMADHYFDD